MKEISAERILRQAGKRFAHAEVFEQSGESLSVSFEDSRLKRITTRQSHGIGLRVVHEGRIGFAGTTDLRDLDRLLDMAEASARYGDEPRFEMPGRPPEVPVPEIWDDAVPDMTPQEMVEMGRAGLEATREANEGYLYSCAVSRATHTQRVLNTSGLDAESRATDMAAHAGIEEVGDHGLLQVYEARAEVRRFDSIMDLVGTVLRKAEQASEIALARREQMSVIFAPKALGNLIGPLFLAMNGKHVQKGSSVLRDRVGQQVLDERITVTDDPTVPFRLRTCVLDDEGTPTQGRHLFENGVLGGFLTDRQTAGLLGVEPSGNGFRSFASRPAPAPHNILIAPGGVPMQEMIQGLERGLIVDQTLGSGQSNALAGEFSVNVSLGFLVENGRVVGRVKDCMVAGNVYELLKDHLEAISSEREWIGGAYAPAVMVGGITLSAGG